MQKLRFTRLKNAFSKKWQNEVLMFALFVAWHNFSQPHMTLGTSRAVAVRLAGETWTMEKLLNESAKATA